MSRLPAPSLYILRNGSGPTSRILCDDGEWRAPLHVGPGAWRAKAWRTRRGADRAAEAARAIRPQVRAEGA